MSHADLSVVTISDDTYYEMKDEGKLDDTIIYVLSSEYVNAHGKRVIKVATPELDDDAATRGYVDGISATLSADLSTIRVFAESTLSGQLSAVSADVDDLVEISAKINNRLSSVESHYDKTFEKDVPIKHYTSDELPCDVLSIDRLILTDEDAYRSTAAEKKYALALKYGTLVLVERS